MRRLGLQGVVRGRRFKVTTIPVAELEEKVREWAQRVRGLGLVDIRLGWDPRRAEKMANRYRIEVWAHA